MEYARFSDALAKLTAPKIKLIAQACGSATTAGKPALIELLYRAVSLRVNSVTKPYRLISVDLGVKNIGVTYLYIPPLSKRGSRPVAEKCYRGSLPAANVYVYPDFADLAVEFTSELIAKASGPVDGVILERQRLHAAEGNVPPDVVRANLLEAMAFTALRVNNANLYLESVAPRQVLRHWLPPSSSAKQTNRTVSARYLQAKLARKSLVSGWLEDPAKSPVDLGSSGVAASLTQAGKQDDIADSLVQALTWAQWRRNAYRLVRNVKKGEDLTSGLAIPSEKK